MDQEKQQIIADMIAFAKADNIVNEKEKEFILAVASRMGIKADEVSTIFEQPHKPRTFATELERITHFHRLLLLMHIDQNADLAEANALRNYGLRLGIRAEAITQLLDEIQTAENHMIPSQRIIEIFKKFYN